MNECDHIIGIEEYNDGTDFNYIFKSKGFKERSFCDFFEFCPECGSKLNERV